MNREREQLEQINYCFRWSYKHYAQKLFGLTSANLLTLNKREHAELADIIYERVKKMATWQKYFFMPLMACLIIPNFWIWGFYFVGERLWYSWQYVENLDRLKRTYGRDWASKIAFVAQQ